MSSDIIQSDIKDTKVDEPSKISQFLGNKDCNDLYLNPIPNDVDDLLTCIETWKRDNSGSSPDNLDNLILSEKLLENDGLMHCDKSDSTTVSDGCNELIETNFGDIINDNKSDKIIKSPLDNNTPSDINPLLTVEDILYSPINNSYDNELYNKKTEVMPNPFSYYDYSPINKKSLHIPTNGSNIPTNKQNIDMKMVEEAAASSEKVRGVCFCKSDKSWTAWWTEKGRNRKKAFKLSIYGFEEARRLAIAHRKAVENRIPELKYKTNTIKVKPSKRQVTRFPRVMNSQIHNINDEFIGNESYNDISRKFMFTDKKRTKFCHYYKSPYQPLESIRDCSTAEDSQLPSPLTSKASMETLENEIIHNNDNINIRPNIYAESGKQSLDKIFADTPRGVSYSVVNQAWCTQWCNNNGAPCIKSFSVSKYGFEKARAMAIEHRRMLESTDQIGSRIPGVFFKDNAWCATWTDINGKRNFRSFPVGPNMTYDNARTIAITCKKNATNDSELVEPVTKVNLELQDLYKLATCTLDVDIDDNINVEQNLENPSINTNVNNITYPNINNINKPINNNIDLAKMQKMIYNTDNIDYMYNKWVDQSNVAKSHLIREVPLQRQVANHLSRILLSNQVELQNLVNIRFLVGNGHAFHQMLSNKQAKNKIFGLVLMTRDTEL